MAAPSVVNGVHVGRRNGQRTNNSPPPSTIAAQIVENHSTAAAADQPQNRATFRQLLEEIRYSPENVEADIQVIHKLIFVVADAGLDALLKDDPFLVHDEAISQAIACLDVIEIAFKRCPEVILPTDSAKGEVSNELCLLLFPRLFALLSHFQDDALQDRVVQIFSSILLCLERNPEHWKRSSILIELYQNCVGDILACLENPLVHNRGPQDPIDLQLPSSSTIAALCHTTQQPIALKRGNQCHVKNFSQALILVSTIISSSLKSRASSSRNSIVSGNLQGTAPYSAIGALIRVRKDCLSVRNLDQKYAIISKSFLQAVEAIAIQAVEDGSCVIFSRKVSMLVVSCVNQILSWPIELLNLDHQSYLAHLLIILLSLTFKSARGYEQSRRKFGQSLISLCQDQSKLKELTLDLQTAIKLSITCFFPSISTEFDIKITREEWLQGFSNSRMQQTFEALDLKPVVGLYDQDDERPSKRQRYSDRLRSASDHKGSSPIFAEFCKLLGDWDLGNIQGLGDAIEGLFQNLSVAQVSKAIELLTVLPCCSASTQAFEKRLPCPFCDRGEQGTREIRSEQWDEKTWNWMYDVLTKLIRSKDVQLSKENKATLLLAVKRFLCHTNSMAHLDLTSSELGKSCLQGLRNSYREVRIATVGLLPSFLRQESSGQAEKLFKTNRILVFDFLRQLSESNDSRYGETIILAYGQVASTCGDEEMNLSLLHLVEYLGHTNALVCSLAHVELRRLASDTSSSAEDLLRPFWRTIAITVFKDLQNRPQKAQHLADLLGLSVNQLLLNTQTEIIAYLVLWKRKDILQRIASARGDEANIWSLCMQNRNLAAILSHIIAQNPKETEAAISALLTYIAPEFKNEDVSNLLKVDPISVACEILKLAGDEESENKKKIVDGFRNFVLIVERRGQGTRHTINQAKAMGVFFETHALGMMTSFSDIIDNPSQPSIEKKRCLKGIEQMVMAGENHIAFAVPQIRACLQSALNSNELRDVAFSAWSSLLSSLKSEEELESLIDPTFAAIVLHWEEFTSITQDSAYNAITNLLKDHNALIQNNVLSIPSLSSIPIMAKIDSQLSKLRRELDTGQHLQAFTRRCQDENSAVVFQALRELLPFLNAHQQWIHESTLDEQPNPVISELVRALMDAAVKFNEEQISLACLASECLGVIGCLDPNRVEAVREKHELVALSNFSQASEAVEFVAFLLENVLVKAFHSVSNPRAQGFLAYAMQELLKFCGFTKEATHPFRPQGSQADDVHQRWQQLSESTRNTLTPFLSSRYVLTQSIRAPTRQTYPIYKPQITHGRWLRDFVFDLLQRAKGDNAQMIFSVLSRIIRGYDVSVASSLLPFAAANVIITGDENEAKDVQTEFLTILEQSSREKSLVETETIKLCSDNVFQVLDYLSRWVQATKRKLLFLKSDREKQQGVAQTQRVEGLLLSIPADVISRCAVECGSYARALFHWEEFIRQQKNNANLDASTKEQLYGRLRDIYAEIDEPDGVEGISAYLSVLSPEQQVLEHRRAGRWAAAQSWYELQLQKDPEDLETHFSLMTCLQEAGQYNVLLEHAKAHTLVKNLSPTFSSLISEASWRTLRWDELGNITGQFAQHNSPDFNTGVGRALIALRNGDKNSFSTTLDALRMNIAKSFSPSTTVSIQACHSQLLKLHALSEVEQIVNGSEKPFNDRVTMHGSLNRRLAVLGSYLSDKQFLLGLRRACMAVSQPNFNDREIASSWMITAKLARKAGQKGQAYDAILHASQLGDDSAKMEQARLLWSDGEYRRAIHCLQSAIDAKVFSSAAANPFPDLTSMASTSMTSVSVDKKDQQNLMEAKALLLLAKWLDRAGQTETKTINAKYQTAAASHSKWEKGFYYLGRYYNKLLESEKSLPINKQSVRYLSGENAKLAIENYLRSLVFGCKYIFETLPKSLTLWLDFGAEITRPPPKEATEDIRIRIAEQRPKMLDGINKQVKKYSARMPTYLLYVALAQLLTRICHSHEDVYEMVSHLLVQIGLAYPQQSLWSLLATMKSSNAERSRRGGKLLLKLKDGKAKISRNEGLNIDMRTLVMQGQKLVDNLLQACEASVDGRPSLVSLSKDLGFSHKVAPCALVVPVQQTLSANLPTVHESVHMKNHKAFPSARDAVTISQFNDDVMVLNSLQKPRKITVRGSDGHKYGLLCKPNDDLRKDQRLMEFNAMINRGLRKDAEASKRRLYVKTYAVTPLNEACGLIEWVDGLKPMRDILLKLYRAKGVTVDYNLLRNMLDEACSIPDPRIFSTTIVNMYQPILHEWFTDLFPEPESWFAARLRYTRSCAVTSIVGYALGLGDRHGENVLLEEHSGGVFHVDFNCLFDRGFTFEKPELVPFRLTHNMVDAFGAYGVEGPFRRSAETTMSVMRAHEDALVTILETFVYDPTADFVRPRKRTVKGVPETPREVLESVRNKLRGLFKEESVPLGVEGHVDALIRQATDPANLCAMYIGWCAFL